MSVCKNFVFIHACNIFFGMGGVYVFNFLCMYACKNVVCMYVCNNFVCMCGVCVCALMIFVHTCVKKFAYMHVYNNFVCMRGMCVCKNVVRMDVCNNFLIRKYGFNAVCV